VRLDPGYCNVVMSTDLLKKATNVLNDGLVASVFDGVVPEEAQVALAVGDRI